MCIGFLIESKHISVIHVIIIEWFSNTMQIYYFGFMLSEPTDGVFLQMSSVYIFSF